MNIKDQVLLKMKLEETFKREMATVFNFMIMNFKLSVFRRETFNPYDYQQLWRDLLTKHYKRVQRNFLNIEGKKELDINTLQDQTIKLALETWAANMADQVASEITRTSLDDVRKAMEQAQEESEERLDAMALALAAAVILRRRFNSRKSVIATTETNSSSENTKLTENSVKGEVIVAGVIAAKLTIKIWNTVGDDRVRDTHKAANGQRRKLNEPFTVGGELFMYPSDRQFGPSIGNVINCRCTLSYV